MNLSLFIVCTLLLMLYRLTETAFRYSFRYRQDTKDEFGFAERLISKYYDKPGLFLCSTRVVSLLSLALVIYFALKLLNLWSPTPYDWLNLIIYAFILLLFLFAAGFLLPRILAGRYPDKILTILIFPVYFLGLIFIPITRLLLTFLRFLAGLFGVNLKDRTLAYVLGSRELMDPELHPALTTSEPEIKENEKKIFEGALEFSKVRVRDCIVPRTEIKAVERNDSLDVLLQTFISSGKTKIIVYEEDLDHIVGYVHSSEMFRLSKGSTWTESIRTIPVVPESMGAQRMMQIFMQEKKSLAVVVDEFGGTTGIISLEDLVEEIFGDIEDEHDVVTYTAKALENNEYLLSARLEVEKVNEQFGLTLPESDEYLTIGGLILFHYQDFPKAGQTVSIGPYHFKILKVTTSKIDLVKLKVEPQRKNETKA